MTITIGDTTFDRVSYDAEGDVLYLHRGDPAAAVAFDASPEGHHLRFDAEQRLVGVTILNARWLLEHEGKIVLTLPDRIEITPEALNAEEIWRRIESRPTVTLGESTAATLRRERNARER